MYVLLLVGTAAGVGGAAYDGHAAAQSAQQNWPAFVVVAGLLLIGLVAADDHLFSAAGHRLASAARDGRVLLAGVSLLTVVVTAVLNLDTSVAFLTPVVIHTARRRGEDGAVLLAACLLLSNAGSLLLPGSNLTNLIVLGHLHLSGAAFAQRMGLPWLVAVGLTGTVVAVIGRRELRHHLRVEGDPDKPVIGLGLAAVMIAGLLVVLLKTPALPVLAVGVVAAGARVSTRRISLESALEVVGVPVLLGLFGVAVGLGVVGRDWDLPARVMAHLDPWATAGAAAVATVIFNNLPAASLLSARVPAHPLSLLIGLNLGPNLFVSGSLAWLLWMRAVRGAGGEPPVRRTVKIGLVAAPLSIAGAVGALLLAGHLT